VKIIHFEDEWPKARSIAHRLHDRIFEFLPPEKQINVDLAEEEDSASDRPSKIVVTITKRQPQVLFEYVFVTEIETLRSMATKDDIVIVDIMRNDQNGRFVSILDTVLAIFRTGRFNKDNWRYFSAYPEKVPSDCELDGFTKKQNSELIEFLFCKICERRSW
jgi:hypothetical protein